MVTALDDAVGHLIHSLKRKEMLEDTIIFFTADVSRSSIVSLFVRAVEFHPMKEQSSFTVCRSSRVSLYVRAV